MMILENFLFDFFEACRPHADILAVIALIVVISLYGYAFYVKFHD